MQLKWTLKEWSDVTWLSIKHCFFILLFACYSLAFCFIGVYARKILLDSAFPLNRIHSMHNCRVTLMVFRAHCVVHTSSIFLWQKSYSNQRWDNMQCDDSFNRLFILSFCTAPDPPANLSAVARSGKLAVISWSPPSKGNFSSFKLRVSTICFDEFALMNYD